MKIKIAWLMSLLLPGVILAQEKKVTGTVTDEETGETLPGVSVVVKHTTKGTSTDFDGLYSMKVSEKDTLVFSFVGMNSQEIAVAGKSKIDVIMSSGIQMEELVVTALGLKRSEKAIGYSSQQISGDMAIDKANVNPIAGLSGKVSGVQVINSSGVPGSSSKVVIRGNASFGNNQPLIVIDGIPMDNSTSRTGASNVDGVDLSNRAIDINPDDIESVTVLKGPAAAALYGSRAGNGVILYTTKKGVAGKISGSVSSTVTAARATNFHKQQQKYGQAGEGSSMSWGPEVSQDELVDNMGEFFKTGITHNHNLSLMGGSDKAKVRASIGYMNSDGVIPNSNFERITARVNTDVKFTDKLSLTAGANIIKSGGNRPQKGSNLGGVMLSLYRTPNNYSLKDAYEKSGGENENYTVWYDNPYWSAENVTYKDDVLRFLGNANLGYDFTPANGKLNSLKLNYRVGIDNYSDNRKGFIPIGSNIVDGRTGQITDYNQVFTELNQDLILTGSKTWGKDFSLDFLAGANARNLNDKWTQQDGYGLADNSYANISNASSVINDQYTTKINEYSVYADAQFGWKNMLFLGVTARNEWSSNFASGRNNFIYPAVSTSFVFTELAKNKKFGPLTFGKIRASIAQTGIAPRPYAYINATEPVNVRDGYTDGNTATSGGASHINYSDIMANENLRPEVNTGKEVGIDLRFWEGRLNFDAAYYHQTTKDILVDVPVSAATGFLYKYINAAEMVNQGVELSIDGDIIKRKGFTWNTGFNFSKNINKVTKLPEGIEEVALGGGFTSISSYARVGESFGVMYGDAWLRNDAGQLIVDDFGYAQIAPDRQRIGDPTPDFLLGWRNSFSYKNFTLSAFIDSKWGGDVYNGTKAMMSYRGISEESGDRTGEVILDGVKADGSKNDVAISKEDYWKFYKGIAGASEEAVEKDVNFIKLREVALSYKLPFKKSKFFKDATFSASVNNILLWTNYSSGDPETSLTGAGSNTQGFDYFNNPNTTSVSLGVKLGF